MNGSKTAVGSSSQEPCRSSSSRMTKQSWFYGKPSEGKTVQRENPSKGNPVPVESDICIRVPDVIVEHTAGDTFDQRLLNTREAAPASTIDSLLLVLRSLLGRSLVSSCSLLDANTDQDGDDADTDGEEEQSSTPDCPDFGLAPGPSTDTSINASTSSLSSPPSSSNSASIHSYSMSASLTDSSASVGSTHLQGRSSLENHDARSTASPSSTTNKFPESAQYSYSRSSLRVVGDPPNSRQSFTGASFNGRSGPACEEHRDRIKSTPLVSPALLLRELCGNLNRTLTKENARNILEHDTSDSGNIAGRKKPALEVIANIQSVLDSTRNERESVIIR